MFTVRQANATLPLVRAITEDLTRLAREVAERRQRVALLVGGRAPDDGDPYRSELSEIEAHLEIDTRRLEEYNDELRQLGAEPCDAVRGAVDFPTVFEGRLAYLCWRLGEPEIAYWHKADEDARRRRPLVLDPSGKLRHG
jgi:hypothetical protein